MPLEPQPGTSARVPCRWCGSFNPVKLMEGRSSFECGKCHRVTEVEVVKEGPLWRLRTRPGDSPSV